jgi:type IV pilus assembly protein PilE
VNKKNVAIGGFSLLELMIALVVIVVLAAIGYPSYQDHLRKGRRAAAQTFIVETASRQQQYLLDARIYAVGDGAIAALNLTVPAEVAPYYTITVEPAAPTTPPTYTIRAAPVSGSQQAADGDLTMDQTGNKLRGGTHAW